MNFLVSIETPGRGSYVVGVVSAATKEDAQDHVFERLVSAGIPSRKIGKQVVDKSSLHIGLSTISVVPIKEFDSTVAQVVVALL